MQIKKEDIDSVRSFNRFYTIVAGWLDLHLHHTPFSLPEARVLYELKHHPSATSSDLLQLLRMDKGYLSRILSTLERRQLLVKVRSKADARSTLLKLTDKGRNEFSKLNQASIDHVSSMLRHLTRSETSDLLHHMKQVRSILEKTKMYEEA